MKGSQDSEQLRVLVVHEGKRGPTATQKISFGLPFDPSHGPTPTSIAFEADHSDGFDISKAFADHRPNLLVLSRYTSRRGSDWIAAARDAQVPVIFHIDDDLLAVPSSLGEAKFKAYNDPARLDALRNNMVISDLVYASTPRLAKQLKDHSITTPIVAGDIYCSVSAEEVGALFQPATWPVIGYMGSSGHSADLATVLPAICDLMEVVPGLQFEVFGSVEMPAELRRFGARVRHLPGISDYTKFRARLRSLGWWIGLAPLEDNAFNRCKADTKWVEYSLAGIAVVASDLPVYRRACAGGAGRLAATVAAWKNDLLELLHKPSLRGQIIQNAQAKLRQHYSHESLRRQVMRVFDEALSLHQAAAGLRQLALQPASLGGLPQPEH